MVIWTFIHFGQHDAHHAESSSFVVRTCTFDDKHWFWGFRIWKYLHIGDGQSSQGPVDANPLHILCLNVEISCDCLPSRLHWTSASIWDVDAIIARKLRNSLNDGTKMTHLSLYLFVCGLLFKTFGHLRFRCNNVVVNKFICEVKRMKKCFVLVFPLFSSHPPPTPRVIIYLKKSLHKLTFF